MIPNPEYSDDPSIGKYESFGVAAFELWQVKAGTIFDNVLITDDPAEAEKVRKETWEASKDKENAMFEKAEDERRAKEEAETKEGGGDMGDDGGDDAYGDEDDDEAGADAEADEGAADKDEV